MVGLQRKIFRNVNILHSLCVRCGFWWFLPWERQEMYKVLKHTFRFWAFRHERPRLGGLPHLDTFTWQIVAPADRVTLLGRPGNPPRRSPHLSCKRDQSKIRNYMDRWVTPPRRVTSPTWGPPPPCKQALREAYGSFNTSLMRIFFLSKALHASIPFSISIIRNIHLLS